MDAMPAEEQSKILFVDDEENVLRSLRRLFIDEGYEIFTVTSAREGLEVLRDNEIAVIISDQRMPQMSGEEFLESAKRIRPDSVRIILTGYADAATAIDAINKGAAYRYLTKPWNDDDLILTIRGAVEQYRLVKENAYLTELTKKQNEELRKWNTELETYVQEQTVDLTYKNKELLEMNQKLRRNFREFTITISNLIELRDKSVANHSNNVAVISREITGTLGLSGNEVQNIAIAAQLHDIGKIGINDIVLLKTVESLAPYEMHEYRKHPVRGQAALDSNEVFREAGVLIRHHHESMNGNGFPDGLAGDKIPLGSRIISIADKYDRLLTSRTMEAALEEIHDLLEREFDPTLYYPLVEAAKAATQSVPLMNRKVEKGMHPADLMPGMVLSENVRSGTGVLLISKGAVLDTRRIDSIKRHFHLDPPEVGAVYVWAD
jgi:response regulator RpfG family c-di-GMP phosphodiesterase